MPAIDRDEIRTLFSSVRRRAPRVQCLTNTVAQALTANGLHAIGAGASMAVHPGEVVAMASGADAVLVNLGTPDAARADAIARLFDGGALAGKPVVLDPVFVHASPLRRDLAARVLAHPDLIIKGNRAEIDAVRALPQARSADRAVWITTGIVDRVVMDGATDEIGGGHPWMAAVTGLGCALGAVVAAFAATTADRRLASMAALTLFAEAGSAAASRSHGPGTFATAFIDELYRLSSLPLSGSAPRPSPPRPSLP